MNSLEAKTIYLVFISYLFDCAAPSSSFTSTSKESKLPNSKGGFCTTSSHCNTDYFCAPLSAGRKKYFGICLPKYLIFESRIKSTVVTPCKCPKGTTCTFLLKFRLAKTMKKVKCFLFSFLIIDVREHCTVFDLKCLRRTRKETEVVFIP